MDTKHALAQTAGRQLIDEGNQSTLHDQFGLVATSALWETALGDAALEQLRRLRNSAPIASVVFADTTGIRTASMITVEPGVKLPSAVSLLDLGSLLNAAVLYDHILYLGPIPTPWCDDLGLYLNSKLHSDVFVPLEVAGPAREDEGLGLALHQLFLDAENQLASIFGKRRSALEPAPRISREELQAIRKNWAALSGRKLADLAAESLYDPAVANHDWRSANSGYGAWLVSRSAADDPAVAGEFADSGAFDEYLGHHGLASAVTEVHLRALFNSALAYNVLEVPYRASAVRQPWVRLSNDRMISTIALLELESLLESTVRLRRVQFQRPLAAAVKFPSVLSVALREAARPEALWYVAGQMRRELRPYRERFFEILRVLRTGEDPVDQRYAQEIVESLRSSIRGSLADAATTAIELGVAVVPKVAGAPTGAAGVSLLTSLAAAASDRGRTKDFVRRFLQPELHVLANLSREAGAANASLSHVSRIWDCGRERIEEITLRLGRLEA